MNQIRTRFAPSPTGFMHIGNLRTALYGYLFAKSKGGAFVLRIEDTDRERYVEGATDVIYNTLRLAGLPHNEGPDIGGNFAPYVQSERCDIYKHYALQLVERGEAYYCFCSKEETDAAKTEEGYNRHCRNLAADEVQHNLQDGRPYVIRQKMPLDGSTVYNDLVFGTIEVENRLLDDQILLKSDGMPTYNFANVVDDHLMQISHVIRGSEYLSSTPKYVLLYKGFGWDVPEFVHLPLIMGKNADGSVAKLSKRHGATGFQELIDDGYLPGAIVNYIALLGWSPKDDREIFTMPELVATFDLAGINKSPAVFDYQKLNWVNGEHIKLMPFGEFCAMALPFAKVQSTPLETKWTLIATLLQPRLHKFSQIPEMIDFLHHLPPYDAELFVNQKNKSTVASSIDILATALDMLKSLDTWDAASLHDVCSTLAQSKGIKFGTIMWPLRIALSGLTVTPGGATDIMEIIGREQALQRIEAGLAKLRN
jgi:glutamyl-tRNA synthetase